MIPEQKITELLSKDLQFAKNYISLYAFNFQFEDDGGIDLWLDPLHQKPIIQKALDLNQKYMISIHQYKKLTVKLQLFMLNFYQMLTIE